MIPFLAVPFLAAQATPAPLPVVDAKTLPRAARGPMAPQVPDPGAARDLQGQMRRNARQGPSIPALQLPAGSLRVRDQVPDISGWRAYAVDVPPGGKVAVQVVEGRKGWFRVLGVNAWGREEEGLLQNRIPSGEPRATYQNPGTEPRTIYFIVDTLDATMVGDAFEVEVTRD